VVAKVEKGLGGQACRLHHLLYQQAQGSQHCSCLTGHVFVKLVSVQGTLDNLYSVHQLSALARWHSWHLLQPYHAAAAFSAIVAHCY
jgi:hypothetical protein